jgi:hypothetical protein
MVNVIIQITGLAGAFACQKTYRKRNKRNKQPESFTGKGFMPACRKEACNRTLLHPSKMKIFFSK